MYTALHTRFHIFGGAKPSSGAKWGPRLQFRQRTISHGVDLDRLDQSEEHKQKAQRLLAQLMWDFCGKLGFLRGFYKEIFLGAGHRP